MPTDAVPRTVSFKCGYSAIRWCAVFAVRLRTGVGFTPVRSELKGIDSRMVIFNAETMEEYPAQANQALGFVTAMYGSVGMFALILACVGLAASQRNRWSAGARKSEFAWPWAHGVRRYCAW